MKTHCTCSPDIHSIDDICPSCRAEYDLMMAAIDRWDDEEERKLDEMEEYYTKGH